MSTSNVTSEEPPVGSSVSEAHAETHEAGEHLISNPTGEGGQESTETYRSTTDVRLFQDFFERDLLISTLTIANGDIFTVPQQLDPWALYFAQTSVQNKLAGWQFINADLIVTFTMVAPGACYGLYNVQCICDGGGNEFTWDDVWMIQLMILRGILRKTYMDFLIVKPTIPFL